MLTIDTNRTVIMNGKAECSSFDDNAPSKAKEYSNWVISVQKLLNSKGEKLVEETGKFDEATRKLYNAHKDRIDRELKEKGITPPSLKPKGIASSVSTAMALENPGNGITEVIVPKVNAIPRPTPTVPDKPTDASFSTKWAGYSKTKKVVIVSSVLATLGIIGYFTYKKLSK